MRTDQTAIPDSLHILQAVIGATPDAIFVKDLSGRYVLINAAAAAFVGKPAAEIVGRHDLELYPEETARRFIDADRQVLDSGDAQTFEGVATANGLTQTYLVTKNVYRDHDGAIVGLFGISHDITERKRAEAAIRKSEEYRNLFRLANDPIVIHDPHTHLVIDANDRACAAYGFGRDVFIGKSLTALSREPGLCAEHWERVVADTTAPPLQVVQYRADGTAVEFVISSSLIEYHGRPAVLSINRDVTERTRIQSELERTRDVALESLRVKSEFLANMSHEIRTPMNGVLGMTELTLDTLLTPQQREYLEMVRLSADSLLAIIDDILDFSKIEAGRLMLDPIEFDLQDSIGDMMKPLAIRADQKGIELTCRIAPDVPTWIVGDPGRLRQILVNLVGNAIKFTQRGEVSVSVDCASAGDRMELHVTVTDTGIGVPLDKQSLIFAAFAQADGSTTRQYGGTGLGLAITSQLVELMGGRIWIESPAPRPIPDDGGLGSRFHFTAGIERGPAAGSCVTLPLAVSNVDVLVVDDNRTNRGILEEILLDWRMKPTGVDSGTAALAEMTRMAAIGQPYALVLLDAHMPEMDGFAVARAIRESPNLTASMILMLSSLEPHSDPRIEDLGFAAYLSKPIKSSTLRETVARLFGMSTNTIHVSGTSLKAPDTVRPLHVLVVEDTTINQRLVTALLAKHGHVVDIAANGIDALAAIAARAYDLVLMDVQMPEMNGFEAAERIRQRERVRGDGHIPIIAMTAHAMQGDRERCLAAGMDGYVSKPLRVNALWQEIARVIPGCPTIGGTDRMVP